MICNLWYIHFTKQQVCEWFNCLIFFCKCFYACLLIRFQFCFQPEYLMYPYLGTSTRWLTDVWRVFNTSCSWFLCLGLTLISERKILRFKTKSLVSDLHCLMKTNVVLLTKSNDDTGEWMLLRTSVEVFFQHSTTLESVIMFGCVGIPMNFDELS